MTVWNVAPSLDFLPHSGHAPPETSASSSHDGMGPDHDMMPVAPPMPPPDPMATFRPLGRRPAQGLRLQVSRLGGAGLDALVAWTHAHFATYTNIDDQGTIRNLRPPVS